MHLNVCLRYKLSCNGALLDVTVNAVLRTEMLHCRCLCIEKLPISGICGDTLVVIHPAENDLVDEPHCLKDRSQVLVYDIGGRIGSMLTHVYKPFALRRFKDWMRSERGEA